MALVICNSVVRRLREQHPEVLRILEANQTKSESDAAACPAAGGDVGENEPRGPADWPAWADEYESWLEDEMGANQRVNWRGDPGARARFIQLKDCYEQLQIHRRDAAAK